MKALTFLYTRSLKNRVLEEVRNPKSLVKALFLFFAFIVFVVGAVTGVNAGAMPLEWPLLKGFSFLLFLLPYWAGRFGGVGTFGMEDVNFVFTAPILPRSVLLSGLMRRLGGMLVISLAVVVAFAFSSTIAVIGLSHIAWVAVFSVVLSVVCKLMGMHIFVAYKKVYRWIGFSWMLMLFAVFHFYLYRAGWEFNPALLSFLDSIIFAATPLIGWAMAGAFAFMAGQIITGLVFTMLLLTAGGFFFWTVYRSSPDFYDETLGAPVNYDKTEDVRQGALQIGDELKGAGAAVFFYKHRREASRVSRMGILGTGIFMGIALAILWGLHARGLGGDIEVLASLFRVIGVPSTSILAVLIPLIFLMAAYPQFDQGFIELRSPFFYMVPDAPWRKLLWVSMTRIIKICVVAVFVIALGGIVGGVSPVIILLTVLAYFASGFMVLGLRLAMMRFLGVVAGGKQKLVSTVPVMAFVVLGVVGLLGVFYSRPDDMGLVAGLGVFVGWGLVVGVVGFAVALRVLHDVDAAV